MGKMISILAHDRESVEEIGPLDGMSKVTYSDA